MTTATQPRTIAAAGLEPGMMIHSEAGLLALQHVDAVEVTGCSVRVACTDINGRKVAHTFTHGYSVMVEAA